MNIKYILTLSLMLIWKTCFLSVDAKNEEHLSKLSGYNFVEELKYVNTTWIDSVILSMNLDEMIGQLFMVQTFSKDAKPDPDILKLIEHYKIGGLIFMQGTTYNQSYLTSIYQKRASLPLLIGTDAEWGPAMRLTDGYKIPNHLTLGAISNDSLIMEAGRIAGRRLRAIGTHLNFAPVVDVNNNPNNPIINFRSFGEDPEKVAQKAWMFMAGMQGEGVLACAKHFPGHGDTDKDSHLTLPIVNASKERMDSFELYPYRFLIKKGLSAVMTAHLHVPALEKDKGRPTSLSKNVVTGILREDLGFEGLVVTDALNMKGATQYAAPGKIEVEALKAGNDVLLFSENIPLAIQAIKTAIKKRKISRDFLEKRVRKILMAKYWVNKFRPFSEMNNAFQSQNTLDDRVINQIYSEAVTVVKNSGNIPINKNSSSLQIIEIGFIDNSQLTELLQNYYPLNKITLPWNARPEELQDSLLADNLIVQLNLPSQFPQRKFGIDFDLLNRLKELSENRNITLVLLGNPYAIKYLNFADDIICTYESNRFAQRAAARILLGELSSKGKLPVSVSEIYPKGTGIEIVGASSLEFGSIDLDAFDDAQFCRLDSLLQDAVLSGATPGLQVLATYKGKVIYNQSYGYLTYTDPSPVKSDVLYDVASVTKVASSALCLMHLVEQGRVSIDEPIKTYLPRLYENSKGELTIREMMCHQSGLESWIPFYLKTLDRESKPDKLYYRNENGSSYNVKVSDGMYIINHYSDSIRKMIDESPLGEKKYKYSDLGYFYLKEIIEKIGGVEIDQLADSLFYQPMNLKFTRFKPKGKIEPSRLAPSENDDYFRNSEIKGYVHDMAAAMMGGVGGHAGLFTNVVDLARIMQMLLDGGKYNGKQYFRPSTIYEFTSKQFEENRRAICFDKTETDTAKYNPCAQSASPMGFGHSGFTGCYVWADPAYDLVYIFLSNRTYPTMLNKLLADKNYRTEILEEFIGIVQSR